MKISNDMPLARHLVAGFDGPLGTSSWVGCRATRELSLPTVPNGV
jgi:hypothetical protein